MTAEEWLDEHRVAQLVGDEHREITEDDIHSDVAEERRLAVDTTTEARPSIAGVLDD